MLTEAEISQGESKDEHGRRVLVARDSEEWTILAHYRGWCHDLSQCLACQSSKRALAAQAQMLLAGRVRSSADVAVRENRDRPISAIRRLRDLEPHMSLLEARDAIEAVTGRRIGR